MTQETQRKVENFNYHLNGLLYSIDELRSEGFFAQKIKLYCNILSKEIERLYKTVFKDSTQRSHDYFIGLNDWMKIASSTYERFDKLPEESKVKYLNALANFNTINLK